jgi:RNA polymerase sigma-70 factor (ECF subfamily)
LNSTAEEIQLVIAARAGDRTAFGRLYGLYARMVHGIILARVPRAEVEDLVQDVFIQALKRLAGLRDAAAFPGWLAAIARNRANDYHRHAHETDELPADLAGGHQPDAEAAIVLAAIRSLPDAYRETMTLRLVEGMTGPEISARTGLQPDSVRVNLHRGFKLLRAKLDVKAVGERI